MSAKEFNKYIELKSNEPFKWGTNDCIQFTINGLEAQSKPVPEPLRSFVYQSELGALKALRKALSEYEVEDLPSLLDILFERTTILPERGSIVGKRAIKDTTTGYLLGFVDGRHGVFVNKEGLVFLPLDPDNDIYWRI